MDQARGLSVPTRGKVAFALAVVSAEGLRDDGVFLWLRDVFRGGTSGKLVYNSADSLLCQCCNSNVLLMRIEDHHGVISVVVVQRSRSPN